MHWDRRTNGSAVRWESRSEGWNASAKGWKAVFGHARGEDEKSWSWRDERKKETGLWRCRVETSGTSSWIEMDRGGGADVLCV